MIWTYVYCAIEMLILIWQVEFLTNENVDPKTDFWTYELNNPKQFWHIEWTCNDEI